MHKPSFYYLIQRLQECIRTANARRIVRGLENSASTSLLIYSDYALQECSLLKVTAVYALNYLELQFLSANIIALVGTVLYNAIKEYHDNGTRKTIYFHSYTIEDNYNAICKKSNVTMLDNYHDNDVNNILIKYKYRTGYSNKEDIEADEREEETRVRLRKLLEKIHDILLREFRGANNFIESMIHNDDEQKLEPEDCNALVERYEEEINCSDLYSIM
ncbi:hypothetical protein HBH92_160940 [Parastagonospora nodorum]|nr:hypothetical protein HBH92_160940 [Parastagonospora nodorum]KAH4495191.1 hypothetical protein HBH89_148890 [Parastagonospora nodorum]KAH4884024.1 hypothetical protein HBH58_050440 [Parastagonospora nodorum]